MNKTKILFKCLIIASSIMFSSCGGGVKDKDGNTYKIVKIGNQKWMAENLKVSHFRNGDSVPEAKSPEEWKRLGEGGKPAWCIEEFNADNGKKYGKLYNWYAMNDLRGLAPEGWHVPTDKEWTQLTNYLGGEISAAIEMRTSGFTKTGNGTNESGFSGLPGGHCNNNGIFYGLGIFGYWWSATEVNTSNAWMRLLNYRSCRVTRISYNKIYGFSVRCIRN